VQNEDYQPIILVQNGNLSGDDVQELFVATLTGAWPSADALRLLEEMLDLPDLRQQIKVCGIVAKAGGQDQQQRAWSALRQIVAQNAGALGPSETFDLAFVLMQCLDEQHLAEPVFRECTYRLADDASASVRCNALIILRRLAQRADETALALLKRAVNDADERVRLNATTFLLTLGP
jgi:hypothetical protein